MQLTDRNQSLAYPQSFTHECSFFHNVRWPARQTGTRRCWRAAVDGLNPVKSHCPPGFGSSLVRGIFHGDERRDDGGASGADVLASLARPPESATNPSGAP